MMMNTNKMLSVGDVAFVKGGVPVQIMEILRLPNDTHYHIELLQKIVGKDALEVPVKASVIAHNDTELSTKQKTSKKEPESQPIQPRKRAKFDNEEIYKPTFSKSTGPRQSKTSAKAAAIGYSLLTELTETNEKSKKDSQSLLHNPSDVSAVSIPSTVAQTGTQCSQEDYFSQSQEEEEPGKDNEQKYDGHNIVKMTELPFYKFGRGAHTKKPNLDCRICKRRCGWACLTCSDEFTNFPIHHPKNFPECFATHVKEAQKKS